MKMKRTCNCDGIDTGCSQCCTTMPPEEEVRYWREQCEHLKQQNETLQTVNDDMGRRISDYIVTIRVLTELSGHGWLR